MSDRPKITALYAENASPDSIRIEIKKARLVRDRWQRHVDGLARLLDTRLSQIEAGAWPGSTEEPTKPTVAYSGRGQAFCLTCPRPDDENVPLTIDDIEAGELCPNCGRYLVDVAQATEEPTR